MTKKTGLYIHIPFCVRKCNYCAFLSFNAWTSPRKEYTDALCNEIRSRAIAMRGDPKLPCSESDRRISLDTVYVGGGTPSVLDISQMRDIMHTVNTSFGIREDAEITIEVNPGTLGVKDGVTKAKLIAYKSMGFNRISMGVQSMDNDTLHFLGRIHTAENIARDVRLIREAGFSNLNLDLMFSIPRADAGNNASALEDTRKIIALEPEHISCYSLQIEEGTRFAEMIERGEMSEVPDEEDRGTYHAICGLLKDAGYEHYEISNFAKMPGDEKARGFGADGVVAEEIEAESPYRSRHNSAYWNMSDYIGTGLGASGFVCGTRYKNVSDIDKYIEAYSDAGSIENPAETFEFPHEEEHVNTPFDNISEAVFTGLRRREGIRYDDAIAAYEAGRNATLGQSEEKEVAGSASSSVKERFWDIFSEAKAEADEFAGQGLLMIDDDGLRLTEQGIDISNTIMSIFV